MTSTAPADAFTDSALVSVSWLASRLGRPGLVILDASVPPVVPGFTSVNSGQQFAAIPGARRFDYDREVCRPDSSFPHMMPGADLFQKQARKIGIHSNSLIVVYDDAGIYASPRAWWMFKAMGHDSVLVLDGGLPAWMEENQEVADEYAADTEMETSWPVRTRGFSVMLPLFLRVCRIRVRGLWMRDRKVDSGVMSRNRVPV